MTEPMKPDDRELEQYLDGGSPLSRRYRDASAESSPPDLDEAILAQARAEARRRPSLNRVLAPLAVAASLVLAVNLAWNVHQSAPVPREATLDAVVPASRPAEVELMERGAPSKVTVAESFPQNPPMPKSEVDTKEVAASQARQDVDQARADAEQEQREVFARQIEAQRRALKSRDEPGIAAPYAPAAPTTGGAPAPAAALAEAAPARAESLSEAQKVDRLIAYIGALDGAIFIRNGEPHTPAEAAKHLQLKRDKAGSRVKTADDFIRLCASYSSMSGEAYLIRFADGRTRTAEDVLREELARLGASAQ